MRKTQEHIRKIVEARRRNGTYAVSVESRKKMSISASLRKMPPMTEEHKKNLSESNKRTWSDPGLLKIHSERMKKKIKEMSDEKKKEWREKIMVSLNTPEHKEKISAKMKELRNDPEWLKKSKEAQKKYMQSLEHSHFYGKHHSIETRKILSKIKIESPKTRRGKDNPAYVDGMGNERKDARVVFSQTLEYRLFRESVMKRDDYTCVLCNVRGGNLCVDHIKSYKNFPELRTDINNGRTLCFECHKKTPNFGRKKQYAEII